MKIVYTISSLVIALFTITSPVSAQSQAPSTIHFDFYGDSISLSYDPSARIEWKSALSDSSVRSFFDAMGRTDYEPMVTSLLGYKERYKLDDWLYYQLIRRTAQAISPKADNYIRYTLYKWFLLMKSGYDATVSVSNDKILFYVQSDEVIYDIPYHIKDGKQYVCLNYHDYGSIDFDKVHFTEVAEPVAGSRKGFSYKITQLPNFKASDYQEKDLQFNVYQNEYHFKVKLNPQVQTIFANYPVVDYASYFNIPLSQETYSSLIPILKKNIKGMTVRNGVDYLMRFTRYAFLFEPDSLNFGKEKRLTPEQTLLFEHSDCEDRAALFFYLVKEIYNLPMIVLSYPKHITMAVQFDQPVGTPIIYNGAKYSVCEPTPQKEDLQMGQTIPELRKKAFEVVYAYTPSIK
ncbi:MAG: hypothetical protein ABI480_07905 [Chitinophagaceae bacterium]